jgi:hypothetical protein
MAELGTILRNIEKQRDQVELEGPILRVTHGDQCQKDMKFIGGGLSDGATQIWVGFTCPAHPEVSVIVRLTASPDTPFQIFEKLGKVTQK